MSISTRVVGQQLDDLPASFRPVLVGHEQVHDNDVGSRLLGYPDGLNPVRSLPRNLNVFLIRPGCPATPAW